MIDLWIIITLSAVFFQNIRSAVQKSLNFKVSTTAATFVRFAFGFPFAICILFFIYNLDNHKFPEPNIIFIHSFITGGIAQIFGTILLLSAFKYRNFAVATAYSKTEPILALLFSIIILKEIFSKSSVLALFIGLIGIFLLTISRSKINLKALISSFYNKSALLGILAGAMFAFSAVFFRRASLSLDSNSFILSAAYTLAFVSTFQAVIMAIYLKIFQSSQINLVFKFWKPSLIAGISGILASLCWFSAITIQNVAFVRALGQIELVLSVIVSIVFFREKCSWLEIFSMIVVSAAIWILLLER